MEELEETEELGLTMMEELEETEEEVGLTASLIVKGIGPGEGGDFIEEGCCSNPIRWEVRGEYWLCIGA